MGEQAIQQKQVGGRLPNNVMLLQVLGQKHMGSVAELDLGPRSFDFKTKALSILYIGSTGLMSVIWTYVLGIILKKDINWFPEQ